MSSELGRIRASARVSRCFCPDESDGGIASACPLSPKRSSASSTPASSGSCPCARQISSACSRVVSPGYQVGGSTVVTTAAQNSGLDPGVAPKIRIRPSSGRCRPLTQRSRVDLPMPFSPVTQTPAPAGTVSATPASTGVEP